MIDLHCHLIPGVDDGPDDLEESLALARLLVEEGVHRVVATPHYLAITREGAWNTMPERCASLNTALEEAGIALEVQLGAEVRICGELVAEFPSGRVPLIGRFGGEDVLLLEFPHTPELPFGSDKLVRWLMGQGVRPMIAHPERTRAFQRDPSLLFPYLDKGCLIQVTAGSLTGAFGDAAQELAEKLLLEDCVTILATDAHDPVRRTPRLMEGVARVRELMGESVAVRLTREAPEALREGLA